MQELKYKRLGTFETEGKVRVSDPGYDKNTHCNGVINMRPGTYKAYVAYNEDGRVARLMIAHATVGNPIEACNRILVDDECVRWLPYWEETDIDVGVDSGQCCFCDEEYVFSENEFSECACLGFPCNSTWYSNCCALTLGRERAGMLPHGAVSESGYGDGGYNCWVHKNSSGLAVSAVVVFV